MFTTYCNISSVIILGDFNCALNVNRLTNINSRATKFSQFVEKLNVVSFCHHENRIGPNWTFKSSSNGPESLVDHIFVPYDIVDSVVDVKILTHNDYNLSDHLPVLASFNFDFHIVRSLQANPGKHAVSWSKAMEGNQIYDYTYKLSNSLWALDSGNIKTADEVDICLDAITTAIEEASKEFLPRKSFIKHLKPYWSVAVKYLHHNMRATRRSWITNEVDNKLFWSLIKSSKRGGQGDGGTCLEVNGELLNDPQSVLTGWASHFQSVFSNDDDPSFDRGFYTEVSNTVNCIREELGRSNPSDKLLTSTHEVCSNLKNNKCGDIDGINYEHLKYGGQLIHLNPVCAPYKVFITRLLEYRHGTSSTTTGFVPDVVRILEKYRLKNHLLTYFKNYIFPSKSVWKKIVRHQIKVIETERRIQSLNDDPELEMFNQIQPDVTPHSVFQIWRSKPTLRWKCQLFVKSCSLVKPSAKRTVLCEKCGQFFTCIISHGLLVCPLFHDPRIEFWESVTSF
ncbi:hypothetical protein LOTGIDRAFT_173750 [Lottia gigantea]|uniref:Endonuclease/exonuclease/phosphatase domain-containing protein n=1 Tax=Lottia gigantea TaxID=225164 RepID=V4APX3_LOTGI|nr:hypothetical protein LOTGIDRAFT_173750 [Lottia gigantea]ESO99262.1 hypothetical protein LOTGIDRAFT_173750 [Lottia gigantea]